MGDSLAHKHGIVDVFGALRSEMGFCWTDDHGKVVFFIKEALSGAAHGTVCRKLCPKSYEFFFLHARRERRVSLLTN